MDKLDSSYVASGIIKWYSHFTRQFSCSSKIVITVTKRHSNSTLRYTPKRRNENMTTQKFVHVCSNTVNNSQKVVEHKRSSKQMTGQTKCVLSIQQNII